MVALDLFLVFFSFAGLAALPASMSFFSFVTAVVRHLRSMDVSFAIPPTERRLWRVP
jgi:hypothetical protein